MAEVSLRTVSKSFGTVPAVRQLSFTIADGEFFVLLGATGAGKTTTLRLVAGLERPDEGQISIAGRSVTTVSPAERDVAFVFQQYSLYPHYTVFENLAFPLRSPLRRRGEADIRKRVVEVAELLRIESKLGNKATQLSGGEMQRVSIGRALVRQPAVFLMDEPLSSLDAKLRDELRIELKRIQVDLGATVLYVTHDQVEALTLADRIGVLRQGSLHQIGAPRAVYGDPDSLFVARQLGSPPINVLPAGALGLAMPDKRRGQVAVRPEDVRLALDSGNQPAHLGKVSQIEHFGAEDVVLLEVEGQALHALARPGLVSRTGQEVACQIDPGTLLFFDETGQRIRFETTSGDREKDAAEVSHVG